MSKVLSLDLRLRVLAAVAEGLSHRAAAARFGGSAASVSRWRRRALVPGDPRPSALCGDRRSGRIEAHRALILGVLAEAPDIAIEELRHLLAGRGPGFGYGTIQRFLVCHRMTHKRKTGHASEQDRALRARRPINRLAFETYVDKVLVPELRAGDIVVMENLSSHNGAAVREIIEAAGAELLFLPPCSPDLNLIEMAFSRLKALLRNSAERTVGGLWAAIARILETFALHECRNYFAACSRHVRLAFAA